MRSSQWCFVVYVPFCIIIATVNGMLASIGVEQMAYVGAEWSWTRRKYGLDCHKCSRFEPKRPHTDSTTSRERIWGTTCSIADQSRAKRGTRQRATRVSVEEPQHQRLLHEFSAKAALLLAEAGGKMSASQFRRRWKFTFPDDSIDR